MRDGGQTFFEHKNVVWDNEWFESMILIAVCLYAFSGSSEHSPSRVRTNPPSAILANSRCQSAEANDVVSRQCTLGSVGSLRRPPIHRHTYTHAHTHRHKQAHKYATSTLKSFLVFSSSKLHSPLSSNLCRRCWTSFGHPKKTFVTHHTTLDPISLWERPHLLMSTPCNCPLVTR